MYNSNIPSRAELPSSKQLVRSTVLAFIAACILLVTVVLPSEYGIDPTGIGGTLGLTKMGQIKVALAEEAKADALQDTSMASMQTAPVAPQAPAPQAPPQSVSQTVASWVSTATAMMRRLMLLCWNLHRKLLRHKYQHRRSRLKSSIP